MTASPRTSTSQQGFAIGKPRSVEQVSQELLRGSVGVVRQPATSRQSRMVSRFSSELIAGAGVRLTALV